MILSYLGRVLWGVKSQIQKLKFFGVHGFLFCSIEPIQKDESYKKSNDNNCLIMTNKSGK